MTIGDNRIFYQHDPMTGGHVDRTQTLTASLALDSSSRRAAIIQNSMIGRSRRFAAERTGMLH